MPPSPPPSSPASGCPYDPNISGDSGETLNLVRDHYGDLLLVTPADFLSFPVPVRTGEQDFSFPNLITAPSPTSEDVQTTDPDLLENDTEDPPAVLEVYDWWNKLSLSYKFCFSDLLLRFRSCLIDSRDDYLLTAHSSVIAKYLLPALKFANRDIFDPVSNLGPLEIREVRTANGMDQAFILGFRIHDKSQGWDANPKFTKFSEEIPMNKRALLTGIFLKPGTIHRDDLTGDSKPMMVPSGSQIGMIVLELKRLCDITGASYGFFSDEIVSVVYDNTECRPPERAVLQVIDPRKISVRMMISILLWVEANRFCINATVILPRPSPYQGALWRGWLKVPGGEMKELILYTRAISPENGILKRTFSEFDIYTLQRCPGAWAGFVEWKQAVEAQARSSPLKAGDILKVNWDAIEKQYTLWRAEPDAYYHDIPEESARIALRYMRPKDRSLQAWAAKAKPEELWFEIEEVRSAGSRQFSQIFFGRLCGRGPLLCLKLFDERYFPFPDDPDDDEAPTVDFENTHASQLLMNLHFAVDMIRREESVYDRLRDFQGSFIPHCYGFHTFTLPGNTWTFPGLLMEIIEGPEIGDCEVHRWTIEEQRDFVTHVRHCERVFKFAEIEQTDWNDRQMMCPVDSSGHRHAVFLDFAFANQRLGEHRGKPPTEDAIVLKYLLIDSGIDRKVMDECWFPLVADEQ
ncbi:hypothetical protein GLOTRDRAFT_133968 [Gloeophyllum trabeum ATCC 11539]|uniref:Uncharacterized protein n=1 Tax=Gloeophyllum trabeum (strain ATCC 11539 / FP-39264 / Madison 617) TaxID=670483 RepID=S7RDA9_GLOTA|nr:uncharacterized protein GLOTRDRAFT_133968 [Gloeophyllum trabeum ATCC 11539]EPQ50414.1 hypothetical protein GLOTRDRAFT_133968 [Gloeophyllum trabeum ATCC 11539]